MFSKKMQKFNEVGAIIMAVLATIGTIWGIFYYESLQAKKRNTIDLEAHAVSKWSKKEITVKKDQLARIRVLNKDTVTHGFELPDLNIEERIIHPGQEEIVEFTPKEAGKFLYRCVVQCDRTQHEFMTGYLIVEE